VLACWARSGPAWSVLHGSCHAMMGWANSSPDMVFTFSLKFVFCKKLFNITKFKKKYDFTLNIEIKLFYAIFIMRAGPGCAKPGQSSRPLDHIGLTISGRTAPSPAWLQSRARPNKLHGTVLEPSYFDHVSGRPRWLGIAITTMHCPTCPCHGADPTVA
jgi:hypothetical protein